MSAALFGYTPDQQATELILGDADVPVRPIARSERIDLNVGHVRGDKKAVVLFDALQPLEPTWRRGAQGIGDCFAEGTMVSGPDGCKPIEEVEIGDSVFAGDGSVTHVVSTQAKQSNKGLVQLKTDAGSLTVTPDHSVLIETSRGNVGWKQAQEVRSDDWLLLPKNLGYQAFDTPGLVSNRHWGYRCKQITHRQGSHKVYDIGVAHDSHSFIADGYIAHNCVSWGFELMCTLHHAVDILVKQEPWKWEGEYATEPLYGGGRVEARGVRTGGWSDGSYGGAQIKWLTKWGALLRKDYSPETGNSEHDLRKYSSKKAKSWGNYGCGGQSDKGALDAIAKKRPVAEGRLVQSVEEAIALIENGYPIAVCSMYGFGSRGSDGFAPRRGSWAHCMCFTGVRYDKPGLLLTNSWGNSWGGGEMPYVKWQEARKCSAWISLSNADGMLRGRDSFAAVGIEGLKRRVIDWRSGWDVSGRN